MKKNGKGVDIVLNLLSGESLHASREVVVEFGKFIETSKRDIMSHGNLNMSPFLTNRSFFGVCLHALDMKCPDEFKRYAPTP